MFFKARIRCRWRVSQELVPLHLSAKHITVYREMNHTCRLSSLILLSPDPYCLLAGLADRVTMVAVCRSTAHLQATYVFRQVQR